MGWLVRDGEVLASLEVAASRRARRKGLLGRDGFDEALLLPGVRSVHTVGMRFGIDVAFLDPEGVVLRVATLPPWRMTRRVHGAACAVETEAGVMGHWELAPGQILEIKGEG